MKDILTHTPCLRKKRKEDDFGYLAIRTTHNRKSTFRSLGLTLHERNWDKYRGRVKPRVAGSAELNQQIEEAINRLKAEEPVKQPVLVDRAEVPTMEFVFNDQIKHLTLLNKHATSFTYRITLRHLLDFWGAHGKGQLYVTEVTSLLVRDFEAYLRSILNLNSAKKYVAVFRKVYKEGRIHGFINNLNDPFISFKATRVPTKRDYLTKNEVDQLISLDLSNQPVLMKVRRQFLFQLFAQGLRVSDLMTLRWGNYQSGDLQFIQFKTKTAHRVTLNKHSMRILGELLPQGIDDLLDMKFKAVVRDQVLEMTYDQWHDLFREEAQATPFAFARGNAKARQELDDLKKQLDGVVEQFVLELHHRIRAQAGKNPNQFIFDILPTELFKNIRFTETTSLPRELYELLKSRTAYYNARLKELQTILGINKTFSSHMMRCTFASLLIDETKTECYAISKLLGHRRVSTTESYIVNSLRKRQDIASDKFGAIFL